MALGHELSRESLLKLSSFIYWGWLYVWVSVSWKESPEWSSRMVTLLHGSIATIAGLMQCDFYNISRCTLTTKIKPQHYALMVWSWGYFAFDLLWCLLYWSDNILMLCHHFSALAAITVFMQKDYTGCTFACTMAMMEITNPLLQTRWFLKNGGYHKTNIFRVVEITYLLTFLGLRGFLGTYIVYKVFMSDIFELDQKLLTLLFYLVSLAFIYDIYGYIIHKYRNEFVNFVQFLDEMGFRLNLEI